jgi:glycosyltransferase involved in cell wall biosynthesis
LFFPLLWLARLRGWSTVFDHHDDAAGMLRAKLGRATLVERLLSVMRRCSTRAADLTITTNDTQRYLVQASARSVAVVRNAPPNWFADHRARSPDGRAKLVFLGEIGIQDRVILAVDILASLIGTHRLDVELLVVGDGPQRGQVERRASALGVASRVTFTGWVPYNTVPALLASAHVGIDTAPKTEVNDGSTMIKILEYLAVGLPVVATALRETLITGLDAVAAVSGDDPDDFAAPIAALISDPEAWAAASTRASERGKCLRWPAQAALLVDEYRRVRQTEMR